jgi:carbon monoxide dehydrogenase subunit G
MREVTVSRFVGATRPAVERALDPATILEAEGTFSVVDTEATDDGTVVTARTTGMEAVFVFSEREDGYQYHQRGESGPFSTMETTLTLASEDEGTRVTMTSDVSLGLPLTALTDRVAGWKRRGELERALDTLTEDVA